MDTTTGQIKQLDKLSKKEIESGKWIEVPSEHMKHLQSMNRKQRREYLRKSGLLKKGRWGWR